MKPPLPEITTAEYHTAGEPFRIVIEGGPELPGGTVADRRARAIESADAQRIRRLLCHEPRGHADMYGCFVVPPDDDGAELGVLFWHKDGFSTACGHGTIALATWAIESGRVAASPEGPTEFCIDVPSGRVTAIAHLAGGRVESVTFRNVPASVLHRGVVVATSVGPVSVDVSYGGAFYASVAAAAVGLAVEPGMVTALTALGREITRAVTDAGLAEHPSDPRLSGCYGTMIVEDLPRTAGMPAGPFQRSITVFADGEVDRSPCGSGTSARMALLHADGLLPPDSVFTHDSIIGTRFTATISATTTEAGRPAVVTDVTGSAYRTGAARFLLDPRDPLDTGFVLR